MWFVLGRREVYSAAPCPGVETQDTYAFLTPIIAAGASSPEPSEARKAAILWFLSFSMVDGMMPYVGWSPRLHCNSQPAKPQNLWRISGAWLNSWWCRVYTPRCRAVRRSGGGACKCALVGSARCMAGGVGGGYVEVAGRTSPRLCWLARASSVQTASDPSASSFASASATARLASPPCQMFQRLSGSHLPRFTPPGL